MKKERSLQNRLLFLPAFILFVCLLLIWLSFDLASKHYLMGTVVRQVKNELEDIDNYYLTYSEEETEMSKRHEGETIQNPEKGFTFSLENAEYSTGYLEETEEGKEYFPVYQLILNSQMQAMNLEAEWLGAQEKWRITELVKLVADLEEGVHRVYGQAATYYVYKKEYLGSYDGYLIRQGGDELYTVIVYANISSMQSLINIVNRILFFLMLGAGILSFLAFYGLCRNIKRSLASLQAYLAKVGNREKVNALAPLAYKELNAVAQSIEDMSRGIDVAEQNQKRFFQNASHELRTPLMSIQGYAEGLEKGILKDRQKAHAILLKESKKMSKLVDEILFLSKMESQSLPVEQEEFDFKELVYDVCWQMKDLADTQGIELELQMPEEALYMVAIYEYMERAVQNLLTNALRYAERYIVLTCVKAEDQIILRIFNDGEKIPEDQISHVFDRFYKGKGGQSGIGLAIVQEIVNLHKGSIAIQSIEQGTEFCLRMPMKKG